MMDGEQGITSSTTDSHISECVSPVPSIVVTTDIQETISTPPLQRQRRIGSSDIADSPRSNVDADCSDRNAQSIQNTSKNVHVNRRSSISNVSDVSGERRSSGSSVGSSHLGSRRSSGGISDDGSGSRCTFTQILHAEIIRVLVP